MSKRRKQAIVEPDVYGIVHLEGKDFLGGRKSTLSSSLATLKEQSGVRGAWLYLDGRDELRLLESALDLGFSFHHARGNLIILGLWLNAQSVSTLPKGSSHTIGVGCMVVDPVKSKVLVVKEKHGAAKDFWKMITGLVEVG